MIFGREPAAFLAVFAALLKVAVGFGLNVSETQQTLLNTFAAAVIAVVLVVVLRTGAWYAALVNLAQAGMALVVGFGLDWSVERQASVMAAVGLVLAFRFVRPQVEAPVSQVEAERKSPLDKSTA